MAAARLKGSASACAARTEAATPTFQARAGFRWTNRSSRTAPPSSRWPGSRSMRSSISNSEFPARRVLRKLLLSPREDDAWTDAERHVFGHDHHRHAVFFARYAVELFRQRLLIDLLRSTFEDDHVVARLEVHGHVRIARDVLRFACVAMRPEVQRAFVPEPPHRNRMRPAVGSCGADPVISRTYQPLFCVAPGEEAVALF